MFADTVFNGAVQGAMLAAVAFLLSWLIRDVVGRALLAFVLTGAAVMYIVFAAQAGESTSWLAGEILGVLIYGTMAVLGLRGSPWWLAAGWALHPVWDIALHYAGPGRTFAPTGYTVSCLGFDLLVAAYVAVAYGTGLVGTRRSVLERARA